MIERILGWLDELRRKESQLALVLSLVIGALVGLVVVAFILLTGRLAARLYPAGGSGWRRALVPILGSLITGFLLYRWFPDARGSGVPQTKTALFLRDGVISLRTVLGKFFCCSASLASGISLGREGPAVQIGAGLASVIARRLGLSKQYVKALVPVGSAAALAAAFNTPIAAVLFSLEEIMGDLHAPILGSVVLSSATSWMVLHLVLGDEPLFHVAGYHLVNPLELLMYALLGVIGGLGSVAFVKLLLRLRRGFLELPRRTGWLQPVAGGLTVGVAGYFFPQVLGVGYADIDRVLAGDVVLKVVVILAVLKIIATAVCYASGNAGGVFGPSLFIGAMMGAAVGSVAHLMMPGLTAGPGAYALVGMGTAFAGIIRAPLTSVIMIFELTRDYNIIVPLMVSNLIAFFISHRLQPQPIYEALARMDGIHLPSRELRPEAARFQILSAMRPAPGILPAQIGIGEALARLRESPLRTWPVADDKGLAGMVQQAELERAVADGRADQQVAALLRDRASAQSQHPDALPHLHPDHSLTLALERLGTLQQDVLPVVSRDNVRELLGVVTLHDILKSYGVARPSGEWRQSGGA
ncbi:MAG TPA: chloride channel protein [Gemmatimonadales bacterium]|nr:chloride channel protein [Gemmatimonadales bacterium]